MVSVSHGHSIHTRGTSCNLCISNKISSGKNIAQSLLWSFSLPWLITFWEVPLQPGGKNSQIGFISTYIRSQVLHFLPLLPNNYKWVKKKKNYTKARDMTRTAGCPMSLRYLKWSHRCCSLPVAQKERRPSFYIFENLLLWWFWLIPNQNVMLH